MTGRASVLWKTSATHPPKISYNQVEEENQGEPANSGLLGNSLWNGDLLSEGWLMTWRQRAIFTCVSLQSQPCAQWEKCIGSIEYEAWPLHCMTVVSYSVVPAELWQLFQVFLVKKYIKTLYWPLVGSAYLRCITSQTRHRAWCRVSFILYTYVNGMVW